jgi:hypothetical protein
LRYIGADQRILLKCILKRIEGITVNDRFGMTNIDVVMPSEDIISALAWGDSGST